MNVGFLDSMKANREGMKAYRMHVSALQLRQNGKHAEATAKLNEAYQLYQQAYKEGFRKPSAELAYAILTMQMGEFERARELMLEVSHNPETSKEDRFTLRVNFSICQWKLGQLDMAIETIRMAGQETMNCLIYTTLGMFLIEKAKETGEFDEALEFNRKAMEYDDEDASTLDNMGQLYLLMAEHERQTGGEKAAEYRAAGADYIRRAYEAKPDQMTSAYYRARLLHEDGDDAAARKILDDTKDVTVTALCPVSRAQLDELRREL